MMKKQTLYFLIVAGILTLYSCNNEANKPASEEVVVETETEAKATKAFFQIPSPMELFMFMWEDKLSFDKTLTNSIEKANQYVERNKKALNLGVYSADLAYSTVFDRNQETMKMFSAVKSIADEMGLIEGFDPSIIERIENNIDHSDSLLAITKDSYNKTLNFLKSTGQMNVFPYVIYGGWLESVYIATQSISKYNAESLIAVRIADQSVLMENLIDFFSTLVDNDEQAKAIMKDLEETAVLFNDGDLDEQAFVQLKEKIKELRNEIVK